MADALRLSYLDLHFADFIVRINGTASDALWWGAALASRAAGNGHSCVKLDDAVKSSFSGMEQFLYRRMPSDIKTWLKTLKQSDTVGEPGEYTPLVLDRSGRLYLQRCWKYEQQIAEGIISRHSMTAVSGANLEAALERYFPYSGHDNLQLTAARMALQHRFSVISGGPGTGKTATVARIIALLLEVSEPATPEIALAAPTGKAALRLHQSILRAAGTLELPDTVRNSLPAEVTTIHRLLGVRGNTDGFRYNRNNRLSCDILVVDEASMVDLRLMASLLEALRDDARIMLLGDRNQLASVEAGAVLADICDSSELAGIPVTQLTRSYRFDGSSGIAALSVLINNGDGAAALTLLQSGQFQDIVWRSLPGGKSFDASFLAAARDGYAGYAAAESPAEALARLDTFRVLSPLCSGPCGVENLNRLCEAACASIRKGDFRGNHPKPLLISANHYELNLFNGDTGVVEDGENGSYAWFENPDGGLRRISTLRLPPGESAFALTVHKSQGSEFDRVLLVIPDQLSDLLCRELLYTAVTRARSHIEIWGTEDSFRQAVERRMVRTSGLIDKLASREAA